MFRSGPYRFRAWVPGLTVSGLALVWLLAGCDKREGPPVLARVGTRPITAEDFALEVRCYQRDERALPEREVLLGRMIARELAAQRARAAGLDRDPEVRRAYDALLEQKLKERELKPEVESGISSQEAQTFYHTNLARYTRPGKTRLAIIYVKADPKASSERQQEAEARVAEARRQAQALPSLTNGFGRVALDFSEDQLSRYKGGDAGWFDETLAEFRLPKEVVSAGLALAKVGDLSQTIKAKDGFYLVAKTDTRDRAVLPFEQVQESIRRQLLAEKRRESAAAFERQLRASVQVETNLQALTQVPYPTNAPASDGRPPALLRAD